jgi:hypothetical protein
VGAAACSRWASGFGGVTGVVLLAESHLAVHTWPAAAVTLDVYVCNSGDNSARRCWAGSLRRNGRACRGARRLASSCRAPAVPRTAAMRHLAIDVILQDEHQALAAMLRSMHLLVTQAQREGR